MKDRAPQKPKVLIVGAPDGSPMYHHSRVGQRALEQKGNDVNVIKCTDKKTLDNCMAHITEHGSDYSYAIFLHTAHFPDMKQWILKAQQHIPAITVLDNLSHFNDADQKELISSGIRLEDIRSPGTAQQRFNALNDTYRGGSSRMNSILT